MCFYASTIPLVLGHIVHACHNSLCTWSGGDAILDSEDFHTSKLLEITADEMYKSRMDVEGKFQGQYTGWKQKDRDAMHKKIEDLL